MTRVLITAFDPYDVWKTNASWMALVELTKDLPQQPKIVTRRYPVDFDLMRERLEQDLRGGFDYALHLGQAPGRAAIQFEMMAINVRRDHSSTEIDQPLVADGPAAYRANLPLPSYVPLVRQLGIPCELSYYAGTYLCNATLYWSRYLCERHDWPTRCGFIHVPLDPTQTADQPQTSPSMPAALVARALHRVLEQLNSH